MLTNFHCIDKFRINDWFAGVRINDIQNDNEEVESDEPLPDSERLRLIYEIITNPTGERGAGINPGLGDFELVESILLLQDDEYNEVCFNEQSHSCCIYI